MRPAAEPAAGRVARLRAAARLAGGAVALLGALVLVGWTLDLAPLKSVGSNLVTMKPNTAFALLVAGGALRAAAARRPGAGRSPLALGAALLVALVGLVTLAEYSTGRDLGVDNLLFVETSGAVLTPVPGRMAPGTAVSFLLLGAALALLLADRAAAAQLLALPAALLALFALLGYLYGVPSLYALPAYVPMAVHTAAGLALLAAGVLLARADTGAMAVLSGDGPGGAMGRRLVPTALAVPIAFGWLRLLGERAGLYRTATGVSLFVLAVVVVLETVVWWNARSLDRVDAERRRAGETIRESEGRFRATFEQAAVGISHVAPDGRWLRVNRKLCEIVGYDREELLATTFQRITHPDDIDADLALVQEVLEGTRPTYAMEKRYLRRDGSIVWINLTVSLVREETGEPRYFIAVVEDIAARKQAETELLELHTVLEQRVRARTAELEAANRDLEAFSYSISHDLRAPLRAIDGFSQALEEDCLEKLGEPGKDSLRRVRAATRRMGELIDDLLELSRITRTPLCRAPVDLVALAREIAAELARAEPFRQVTFRLAEQAETTGDPSLLRIALDNLLRNAWKFTSKRERATIEFGVIEADGQRAGFVRDDGAGFDMAYAGKLFAPFHRLHSSAEFEGTGIGLATVQRIVGRHGGRVWAEAELGRGATFYFTI